MKIMRLLGFVLSGAMWELWGRERALPYIRAGADRLSEIKQEAIEEYQGSKGGSTGTVAPESRARKVSSKGSKTAAAAGPKRGRPPSAATLEKRAKEAQLAALAKGRATRARNLAAKKKETA